MVLVSGMSNDCDEDDYQFAERVQRELCTDVPLTEAAVDRLFGTAFVRGENKGTAIESRSTFVIGGRHIEVTVQDSDLVEGGETCILKCDSLRPDEVGEILAFFRRMEPRE